MAPKKATSPKKSPVKSAKSKSGPTPSKSGATPKSKTPASSPMSKMSAKKEAEPVAETTAEAAVEETAVVKPVVEEVVVKPAVEEVVVQAVEDGSPVSAMHSMPVSAPEEVIDDKAELGMDGVQVVVQDSATPPSAGHFVSPPGAPRRLSKSEQAEFPLVVSEENQEQASPLQPRELPGMEAQPAGEPQQDTPDAPTAKGCRFPNSVFPSCSPVLRRPMRPTSGREKTPAMKKSYLSRFVPRKKSSADSTPADSSPADREPGQISTADDAASPPAGSSSSSADELGMDYITPPIKLNSTHNSPAPHVSNSQDWLYQECPKGAERRAFRDPENFYLTDEAKPKTELPGEDGFARGIEEAMQSHQTNFEKMSNMMEGAGNSGEKGASVEDSPLSDGSPKGKQLLMDDVPGELGGGEVRVGPLPERLPGVEEIKPAQEIKPVQELKPAQEAVGWTCLFSSPVRLFRVMCGLSPPRETAASEPAQGKDGTAAPSGA